MYSTVADGQRFISIDVTEQYGCNKNCYYCLNQFCDVASSGVLGFRLFVFLDISTATVWQLNTLVWPNLLLYTGKDQR